MGALREEHRSGIDYLNEITPFMQRRRAAHPTTGSYETGEIQFWWRAPRWTDDLPQLFWFDDEGLAQAVAFAADFDNGTSLTYGDTTMVFLFMPDATPDLTRQVADRALEHFAEHGINAIDIEVEQDNTILRDILFSHGFEVKEENVLAEAWLSVGDRPAVSPLPEGYRLCGRDELADRPHHMNRAEVPDAQARLEQTSLYRPDHDLVVLDADDNVAALGMFWFDPVTATGAVEPMATNEGHRQRGLARHVLTAGVERLAQAGAERISIGYGPSNTAASDLYRSVGFVPGTHTDLFHRTVTPDEA